MKSVSVEVINILYSSALALSGFLSATVAQSVPLTGSPVVDTLINGGAIAALIYIVVRIAKYQTARVKEKEAENLALRIKIEQDLRNDLAKKEEELKEIRQKVIRENGNIRH